MCLGAGHEELFDCHGTAAPLSEPPLDLCGGTLMREKCRCKGEDHSKPLECHCPSSAKEKEGGAERTKKKGQAKKRGNLTMHLLSQGAVGGLPCLFLIVELSELHKHGFCTSKHPPLMASREEEFGN